MVNFKVWVDNADRDKVDWIEKHTKLSGLKPKWEVLYDGKDFPKNPKLIQDVLYLGNPDIVLTYTSGVVEIPFLVVTLTHHKPVGNNIHQHFACLAAAGENDIPSAFVFPLQAWVERQVKATSGMSSDIRRTLLAQSNIIRFHKTPCLTYFWDTDKQGNVQYDPDFVNAPPSDSIEMRKFFVYVNLLIDCVLQGRQYVELLDQPPVQDKMMEMWNYSAKPEPPEYPNSLDEINTSELIDYITKHVNSPTKAVQDDFSAYKLSQLLASRDKSLIYTIRAKMYPDNENTII